MCQSQHTMKWTINHPASPLTIREFETHIRRIRSERQDPFRECFSFKITRISFRLFTLTTKPSRFQLGRVKRLIYEIDTRHNNTTSSIVKNQFQRFFLINKFQNDFLIKPKREERRRRKVIKSLRSSFIYGESLYGKMFFWRVSLKDDCSI